MQKNINYVQQDHTNQNFEENCSFVIVMQCTATNTINLQVNYNDDVNAVLYFIKSK